MARLPKVLTDEQVRDLESRPRVLTDKQITAITAVEHPNIERSNIKGSGGNLPKVLTDEQIKAFANTNERITEQQRPVSYFERLKRTRNNLPPVLREISDIHFQALLGAANEALLGFPLFMVEKIAGPEARESLTSETWYGKFSRGVGSLVGFSIGFPAKILEKGGQLGVKGVAKLVAKSGKGGKFVKAAGAGGGAFGLYELFKAPERNFGEKVGSVPFAMGLGAAFGIAGEGLKPLAGKAYEKFIERIQKNIPADTAKLESERKARILLTNIMRHDISLGYADKMPITDSKGNIITWRNASTFPPYYSNKGYRKKEVLRILDKVLSGDKTITKRQQEIYEDLLNGLSDEILRAKSVYNDSINYFGKKLGYTKKDQEGILNALKELINGKEYIRYKELINKDAIKETVRLNKFNTLSRIGSSAREHLNSQGEYGQKLVELMDRVQYIGERRWGNAVADYLRITEGMTEAQKKNFVLAAEGKVAPADDKVKRLLFWWRKKGKEIIQEAQELNLDVRTGKYVKTDRGLIRQFERIALMPRQNYFPHLQIDVNSPSEIVKETLEAAVSRGDFNNMTQAMNSWKSYVEYVKSGQKGKDIVQYLIDSGRAKHKAHAEKILNVYMKNVRRRRFSNLELARSLNLPFYDINPDRVLTRYFQGAYHRLEGIRAFGLNDEIANEIIKKMGEQGVDHHYAQTAFARWAGKEGEKRLFMGLMRPNTAQNIRGLETITKLGLAQIPNLGQSFNTMLVAGIRNTLKGIKWAFKKSGRDYALRTGGVLEATIEDVMSRAAGGLPNWGRKFLKKTGFSAVEKMNRIIAANAGREYAINMANKLVNNPANKRARRALIELGLNPAKILKRGGNLTFDEMIISSQKVINKTQFRSGILDLPLFFTSPEGRIMTQFKNFAFNQTKLLKDAIALEVKKGNLVPLARALAIAPIIGEGIKDARAIVTGKKRDKRGLERLSENYAAVGGLGIVTDLWSSAVYNRPLEFVMGPAASDVGGFVVGAAQALQGKPRKLGRTITRQIPVAGPMVKNIMFPSQRDKRRGLQPLQPLSRLERLQALR